MLRDYVEPLLLHAHIFIEEVFGLTIPEQTHKLKEKLRPLVLKAAHESCTGKSLTGRASHQQVDLRFGYIFTTYVPHISKLDGSRVVVLCEPDGILVDLRGVIPGHRDTCFLQGDLSATHPIKQREYNHT